MRYLSYLLLAAVIASCGSARKAVNSFTSKVKKTEFFTKDSTGNSQVESSAKKVDSSHVIEKEESGWERETVEVITEQPYMPSNSEYFDTASFKPVAGGVITRTTTRTIKEKGQKKSETTQQAAVKEEQQQKQAQAALTTETKVKDTAAIVEVKSKQVKRSAWPWYLWPAIILVAVFLLYRYRWPLAERIFGIKRRNNDRT